MTRQYAFPFNHSSHTSKDDVTYYNLSIEFLLYAREEEKLG